MWFFQRSRLLPRPASAFWLHRDSVSGQDMTPSISSLAQAQFCRVFQHQEAQGWCWQGAWVPAACPRVMASSATRLGSPAGSPGWRRGAQMCPPQGIAGRGILREGPELTLFLFWTQKQIQGIVEVRNSTNNRHWKKKKKELSVHVQNRATGRYA